MRVGIIGMGFMGGVHFNAWRDVKNGKVVAVCDANPIGVGAKQGNLGGDAEELDLDGVGIYTEVADMLAKESLDAVSITLPSFLHKSISIQALEAGVHVLCEKPMALSVDDCDAMIAAATKADRQLMVAQCIRFWPAYDLLKQMVETGEFGKVRAADFCRLTYAPSWDADSWFADESKSGGIALDLHLHDVDFIQHLLGVPVGVRSNSVSFDDGVTGHVTTSFDYGNNSVISATASWMMPKSFGFEMSFKVALEKAAVLFDGTTLKVCPSDGEPYEPELCSCDGYIHEIRYFAKLISGEDVKTRITPEQTRESVRLALETI